MAGIFDILGPVMVGPSSSHTAGAVRIGLTARQLFGRQPEKAVVCLHGSFAATGKGHGTDKALIAGLLGMRSDDLRIPDSFLIAEKSGMEYVMKEKEIRGAHPNTVQIIMEAEDAATMEIEAFSSGGGRICVSRLDGIEVRFTREANTLIVRNLDQPGCITDVSTVLSLCGINIATMQVFRAKRGGLAVMVAETDGVVPQSAVEMLERRKGIEKIIFLNVNEEV